MHFNSLALFEAKKELKRYCVYTSTTFRVHEVQTFRTCSEKEGHLAAQKHFVFDQGVSALQRAEQQPLMLFPTQASPARGLSNPAQTPSTSRYKPKKPGKPGINRVGRVGTSI